jgi:germination protein M
MSRRAAAIFLAAVLAVGVLAFAGWRLLARRGQAPAAEFVTPTPGPAANLELILYLPGDGDRLYRETREVVAGADAPSRIRATVEALLAGPRTPGLRPILASGIEVGAVYIGPGAIAYVDLRSAAPAPPSGGSLQETLTVYALVNSVLSNAAEAKKVAWLWNGAQLESFAGHLDATRPFVANSALLAPSS